MMSEYVSYSRDKDAMSLLTTSQQRFAPRQEWGAGGTFDLKCGRAIIGCLKV